jgi:hypothetical protein
MEREGFSFLTTQTNVHRREQNKIASSRTYLRSPRATLKVQPPPPTMHAEEVVDDLQERAVLITRGRTIVPDVAQEEKSKPKSSSLPAKKRKKSTTKSVSCITRKSPRIMAQKKH